MAKRTLLIDGDLLAYKIASALESPIHWGDGLWTLHAEESEAFQAAERWIDSLQGKLEADSVTIALSDSANNWRKDLYPPYKANRAETRKPLVLKPLVQYLFDSSRDIALNRDGEWDTHLVPTLEADDILGILATHKKWKGGERIIVSEDKDLLQIPGFHFNPRNREQGIFEVSKDSANTAFYTQVLTGDVTDNYPGCPGTGPAKAAKLLGKAESLSAKHVWPLIVAAYEKAGLNEKAALIQARVARICRAEDWLPYQNGDRGGRVKLWSPPT